MNLRRDDPDVIVRMLLKQPPSRREQSLKAIESVDKESAKLLRELLKCKIQTRGSKKRPT